MAVPDVRSALAAGLILVLLGGCRGAPDDPPSSPAPAGGAASGPTGSGEASGQAWFTDAALESGLDFVHFSGASGEMLFPEIMGSGVALLDYDNDGDLDAYFAQGRMLAPDGAASEALFPAGAALPAGGRLYRNDLEVAADGTRTPRFTDVTEASGTAADGYGMGVATGDIDNDGWVDLYLTHVGPNQLFRNNRDGTFSDVSQRSGTDDPGWGVSAAFVDYDRDGWLDLYVGNYVHYSTETDIECPSTTGGRDYCPPRVYRAQPDRLFRNQGGGQFADVTATALTGREFGAALGVSTADFDGDGWIDIYVANDGDENLLWINQQDGTFRNTGLLSGSALSTHGTAEASMGVDAGDADNDGDEDLFMTHLRSEGHNLYVNNGTGLFEDLSVRSGLGPGSLGHTGFGTAWFDFDNDGLLDVLVVNGTVHVSREAANERFPYDQPKLLFRNLGDGRFEDVTDQAGAVFGLTHVGRGAAFGDVDNDGDGDVLVSNANAPPQLLLNNVGSQRHWLGLRLTGGENAPRDMLGARVAIMRSGVSTIWRRARADGSYASANDPRVLVGLGMHGEAPRVRIQWPSGRVEDWPDVAIDRWTTLQRRLRERPGEVKRVAKADTIEQDGDRTRQDVDRPERAAAAGVSTLFDRTTVDARYTSGFYELEEDDFERFRWMGIVGRIDFEPQAEAGFVEFRAWSGFFDLRQHLTVESHAGRGTFELPHAWWTISLPVKGGCSSIRLTADRQLPQSGRLEDTRQLAVRIAAPRVHQDVARHRTVAGQLDNAVLNTREGLEGRAELTSTPTNLGIDMYGVCNVKPPCVYCDWDHAKRQEEENVGAPFNLDTHGEYGAFFDNAASLINCSSGEPFMPKEFDDPARCLRHPEQAVQR